MMLMLLLTELTHLEVNLSVESDCLHVQAPAGALTDELRQSMAEHKAALLRYAAYPYVETVDGPGVLTGARRELDPLCYSTRHGERLRYKIGVRLLRVDMERFYLPGTLWVPKCEEEQNESRRLGTRTCLGEMV
jgi:TubC N-terminal docking domain